MNSNDDLDTLEMVEHPLRDAWTLWHHKPHDSSWSADSYANIATCDSVEQVVRLATLLEDVFIKNSMLFLMKEGIRPEWEDPRNCHGGSFSFKVRNEHVCAVWVLLMYAVTGRFISQNDEFLNKITGITLSPKKGTCIIKIWMEDTSFQNPMHISFDIDGLEKHGCLFIEHNTKSNFNKK